MKRKRKLNKLEAALKELLERNGYDIWISVTFRKPVSPSHAKNKFKEFFKYLNKLGEDKFFDKYVIAWVFIEWHRERGGNHIHSILKGIDPSLCPKLERKCIDYFGQSEVKPLHKNVIQYLAKKYDTPNLKDWDFIKVNSYNRF